MRGAAPKSAPADACVNLTERSCSETLLPGKCAGNVGIIQTVADVPTAVRVEPAHDRRRIDCGPGHVYSFEVKHVAASDRCIGKCCGVLPFKCTAGRHVYVGLHDGARSRGRECDAVVCRTRAVRQSNAASAVRANGIRASRERYRLNSRANIDVLKTRGNVAIAVGGKRPGAPKETTLPRAQFRPGHGERILSGQTGIGEFCPGRRGRRRGRPWIRSAASTTCGR